MDIALCLSSFVRSGRLSPLLAGVPMTRVGGMLQDTWWSTIYEEASLALDGLTINCEVADFCSCSLLFPFSSDSSGLVLNAQLQISYCAGSIWSNGVAICSCSLQPCADIPELAQHGASVDPAQVFNSLALSRGRFCTVSHQSWFQE